MVSLQCLSQRGGDAATAVATELALCDAVARGEYPALLHVYSLAGDVVSLGRYRATPELPVPVRLQRRVAGGRVLPAGEGFVHANLILPRRGALLAGAAEWPGERLMNRYARGVLGACRLLGVEALYPGRDLITCRRRALGALALGVEENGVAIFSAQLSVGRSFAALAAILDRIDSGGAIRTPFLSAAETTTLAHERGSEASFAEVADAVAGGFASYLGAAVEMGAAAAPVDAALAGARWLEQRRRAATLSWRGVAWGQLGLVEVFFSVDGDRLGEVQLSGDFIANVSAVRRLEGALRGCPRRREAIDRTLAGALRPPCDFLLGLGAAAALLRDAILGAERS